jgi:hypothetical protein
MAMAFAPAGNYAVTSRPCGIDSNTILHVAFGDTWEEVKKCGKVPNFGLSCGSDVS